MPARVKIDKVPMNLDLDNIDCEANQCFENSYKVAKKYPNVKIVEGIIIVVGKDFHSKVMEHVWNLLDEIHFDITAEQIWITEEYSQVSEVRYALTKIHTLEDVESMKFLNLII